MENGATSAVKHFSLKWSISINESTVRKLEKRREELKEASKSKSGDKNLPHAYLYIKESCDSAPCYQFKFSPIVKFSLFTKFFLCQIFWLYSI